MINFIDIDTEASRLKLLFKRCNPIKAEDLRKIIELIEAVKLGSSSNLERVIDNGSILLKNQSITIQSNKSLDITTNGGGRIKLAGSTDVSDDLVVGRGLANTISDNSITFSDNKIVIKDRVSSKGIEYDGDYEVNFSDKSLVTKKYVDLQGKTLQQVMTSGSTLIGPNQVYLKQSSQYSVEALPIENSGEYGMLNVNNGTSTLEVDPNIAKVIIGKEQAGGIKKTQLRFTRSKTDFIDNTHSKGIEYAGDYESNFGPRSLVTKQYVQANSGVLPYQVLQFDVNESFFLANFDSEGLGINAMIGFAWCNGKNNTVDRRGTVPLGWTNTGQPLGSTIGSSTTTLTENNMPSLVIGECSKTSVQDSSVPAGNTGYYTRVNRTIGVSQPFNNLQPSINTLFVMKLP